VLVLGAVFVLVGVVIAVIVLYQAEIDRHLAHRAGHLLSSVMPAKQPAQYRGVPRFVGHYLTKARRPPSNAVPIRTSVAPSAIASSRSPLIPAAIVVASAGAIRHLPDRPRSLAKAGRAAAPSAAMAITP